MLRMEVETCPCRVCRSDMAYIAPCESPLIIMAEMVIDDPPEQEITKTTSSSGKSNKGREI